MSSLVGQEWVCAGKKGFPLLLDISSVRGVLALAEIELIELIFFIAAGMVQCSGFRRKPCSKSLVEGLDRFCPGLSGNV